ncbi:WD40 repeat domain-containing protein [Pedosphaera parvula]|uniref:WD-40 repeat protein n=1 Tax=Pedosphaera parvula (strain Ellin514) TaxID=320771 RepID=B9XHS8_PEDPL|nr:WD-40 repeat protein [Pedosphaera parvula]EEF60656.1 WD-40 repeat protein [Pedosphaera parvula Ellin514]
MKVGILSIFLLIAISAFSQGTPDILWQKSTPGTPFNGIAVSPDGRLVATAGTNAPVQVWNATNGSLAHSLSGPTSWIGQLAFSPNGGYLAAGSGDRTVTLWETTNWTLVSGFVTHQQGPAIAFSPDSSMIALSSQANVELRSLPKFGLIRSWTAGTNEIPAVAFSPDGTRLASSADFRGQDTRLKMWDVATGNLLWAVPTAQTYSIGSLAFSPDGTRIATANSLLNFSSSVQLFRVTDGALLRTYPENANSVAFSPDGLTTLSAGTNLVLRSVQSGALIASFTDGISANESRAITFAPDGSAFYYGHSSQHLFAARVPIAFHPFLLQPNGWTLRWNGGVGPYQPQFKTNLTDPWQDLGTPSTNQSFTISNQYPNAFFRVIAPQ